MDENAKRKSEGYASGSHQEKGINSNKATIFIMGEYKQFIRSASIGKELDEWLRSHPEVSFSAIAREALERKKRQMERKG